MWRAPPARGIMPPRLEQAATEDLGLEEMAAAGGVMAIEWPERLRRPMTGAVTVDGPFTEASTFPTHSYTIGVIDGTADITSMILSFDGAGFAGQDAPFMDNIVLPNTTLEEAAPVPEPGTLSLLLLPAAIVIRRRMAARQK